MNNLISAHRRRTNSPACGWRRLLAGRVNVLGPHAPTNWNRSADGCSADSSKVGGIGGGIRRRTLTGGRRGFDHRFSFHGSNSTFSCAGTSKHGAVGRQFLPTAHARSLRQHRLDRADGIEEDAPDCKFRCQVQSQNARRLKQNAFKVLRRCERNNGSQRAALRPGSAVLLKQPIPPASAARIFDAS